MTRSSARQELPRRYPTLSDQGEAFVDSSKLALAPNLSTTQENPINEDIQSPELSASPQIMVMQHEASLPYVSEPPSTEQIDAAPMEEEGQAPSSLTNTISGRKRGRPAGSKNKFTLIGSFLS